MTDQEAIVFFKCLSDKSRLAILKSLMEEDMYVERLAERLGLTSATISFHLKKLEDAKAVFSYKDQYYTMYSINKEIFDVSIIEILREEASESELLKEREDAYRQKVIRSFFAYGKLKAIPTQLKKERIVLEEIAKAFEPGKKYSEAEVNDIIGAYYEDFCTLRKDMVDEGILQRKHAVYERV